MPLYEFDCNECHQPFDQFIRSTNKVGEVTCPVCGSDQVAKKISAFAARMGGDGSSYRPSATACSPVGT